MLLQIVGSLVAGGIVGAVHIRQQGMGTDDTKKIERIASNCGLVAKDGNQIRIFKKRRNPEYSEYVFQMPFGLSLKQFQDKINHFNDGLNIKRSLINFNFADLKKINFKKNIPQQIKKMINKTPISKEVEVEYDGMLKFKVYNKPLTAFYELTEDDLKGLKGWEVFVGKSRDSNVIHDFDKIAHTIVGGATDYGKSNFLELVINTLIRRKPKDVSFTLIDLKGGLSFMKYEGLQQVETVVRTPEDAYTGLKTAQDKLNKLFEMLLKNKVEDVKKMGYAKRHFVIIDEAADIADDKDCQEIIKDIARRGRAAGMRLIYATQYPTVETVSSQVKRNCMGRISFVVDSGTASRVVLDENGAEELPLIQGRAIYKTVKKQIVQTAYVSDQFIHDSTAPNINIRARKDDEDNATNIKPTTGKHSLIIEET